MRTKDPQTDPGKASYRSGIAARLAGVPVNTLRIWERRYVVVGPRMSAGRQRLYSAADVRRLAIIKQLVDSGHPIGAVATLDNDALAAMRAETRALAQGAAREIRVALASPMLASDRFEASLAGGALRVVGRCANPAQAVEALAGTRADVVVIEWPTLSEAELERVAPIMAACSAQRAVVLYRYAPGALVRRLRRAGHAIARATTDAQEIEAICAGLVRGAPASAPPAEPAPPRFDEASLASFAGQSRAVECECPRHLVELVLSLGAFERYSAECASRNPADLALHLELGRAAGRARSIVEEALERVARAEGFAVPARRNAP
jgi:DNA-binding transcriptional MerR regulator